MRINLSTRSCNELHFGAARCNALCPSAYFDRLSTSRSVQRSMLHALCPMLYTPPSPQQGLPRRVQNTAYRSLIVGLCVNAQNRLSAGRANHDPLLIAEIELESVQIFG